MRISFLLPAVASVFVGTLLASPSPAKAAPAHEAQKACTFEKLSSADRRRYQSRYRRRVRLDGQAAADRWIHEQVCMTPEQRRARRQAANGNKDRKCRAVSRPVTSMDGSMTVGIGRICK